MTCRTASALALLLSLCAAPLATTAAASVDATATVSAPERAFQAEVGEAVQQAQRGDSLGASIMRVRKLRKRHAAICFVSKRAGSILELTAGMQQAQRGLLRDGDGSPPNTITMLPWPLWPAMVAPLSTAKRLSSR